MLSKNDIHSYLRSCGKNEDRCTILLLWVAIMPPELGDLIFTNGIKLCQYAKKIGVEGISPAVLRYFVIMSADITRRFHDNQPPLPKATIEKMGRKERLVYMNLGKVESLLADTDWTWKGVHHRFLRLIHDQLTGRERLKSNSVMTVRHFQVVSRKFILEKGLRDAKQMEGADICELAEKYLPDNQGENLPDVSKPMPRKRVIQRKE